MQPQGIIQCAHQLDRHKSDAFANASNIHGPDLLSLRLAIAIKSCLVRFEQNLKWVDLLGVGRNRDNCEYTSPEPRSHYIRSIVANDDRGPSLIRLRPHHRVEIDDPDLPTPHQMAKPSPVVESHAPASPSLSQVFQASS
jgi:hypothetical protein